MSDQPALALRIPTAWLALCAALVLPLSAQKPWPPISPEEMAMNDCPQQPGIAAICLYYEKTTAHEYDEISIFKRLKIFTPAGREFANIEIPYFRGWYIVKDLEARVVPAQGQPRPFTARCLIRRPCAAGESGWPSRVSPCPTSSRARSLNTATRSYRTTLEALQQRAPRMP